MPTHSKTLTDHAEIRKWAEARGAKPSVVKRTKGERDETGILRLDFPGYSGAESLEEIPWDQWFEKFDREELALLCQEETADGQRSNFNKIIRANRPNEGQR